MKRIMRTVFQLSLSMLILLLLAFSSGAKQNDGKIKGTDSAEMPAAAEKAPDLVTRNDSSEKAREREEKALERMDEARHRGDTENEEAPPKGLEKQREKKMEQERRELDKGSEQGQKMREERSRKWWKFWE